MNIQFNTPFIYGRDFFKGSILCDSINRQKAIVMVVMVIFSCLAVSCYFMGRRRFKVEPLNNQEIGVVPTLKEKKADSVDKEASQVFFQQEKAEEKPLQRDTQGIQEGFFQGEPQNQLVEKKTSNIEIGTENKLEKSTDQEKFLPYDAPVLLSFGKVREGKDGGKAPTFTGMRAGTTTGISNKKLYPAGFACCFHTSESRMEILNFITHIRAKDDYRFANSAPSSDNYPMSLWRLYNHLVRLHNALPGDSKAKEVKIYWNERLENLLFPYFFKEENEKSNIIGTLLFAIIPGEKCASPFQSSNIDFTYQLEFVGFGKDKLIKEMEKELNRLSCAVMGKNILPEIDQKIACLLPLAYKENPLMKDAHAYTLRNNLRLHLLALETENKTLNFDEMQEDEIKQLLTAL